MVNVGKYTIFNGILLHILTPFFFGGKPFGHFPGDQVVKEGGADEGQGEEVNRQNLPREGEKLSMELSRNFEAKGPPFWRYFDEFILYPWISMNYPKIPSVNTFFEGTVS